MIHGYVRLTATLPVFLAATDTAEHFASIYLPMEPGGYGPTPEDAVAALLQDLQRAGFATALTSGPDLPGQGVLEL